LNAITAPFAVADANDAGIRFQQSDGRSERDQALAADVGDAGGRLGADAPRECVVVGVGSGQAHGTGAACVASERRGFGGGDGWGMVTADDRDAWPDFKPRHGITPGVEVELQNTIAGREVQIGDVDICENTPRRSLRDGHVAGDGSAVPLDREGAGGVAGADLVGNAQAEVVISSRWNRQGVVDPLVICRVRDGYSLVA